MSDDRMSFCDNLTQEKEKFEDNKENFFGIKNVINNSNSKSCKIKHLYVTYSSEDERDTSFEKIFDSLFSCGSSKIFPKPCSKNEKKKSSQNKRFEATCSLQKQEEIDSYSLTQKSSFEKLLEKMLTPTIDVPRKRKRENVNSIDKKIPSALPITENDDDNMCFEALMEKMLTPDNSLHEQQKIHECKKRNVEESQRDSNLEISMSLTGNEQTDVCVKSEEQNVENIIDNMVTPLNKKQKTATCSTQTSFEIFTPNLTQNSNCDGYSQLPYFPSQSFTKTEFNDTSVVNKKKQYDFLVTSQTLNDSQITNTSVVSRRSPNRNMCTTCMDTQKSEKTVNILEILSYDITVTTSGFKIFNNLVKVGTAKWLDSALTLGKTIINKTKKDEVIIMEDRNNYDLYIDKTAKISMECFTKENTKICKIIKNGNRPEIDLSYIYSEDKTENIFVKKLKLSIENIYANKDLIISCCETLQVIDKKKIKSKIQDIFAKIYEAFDNDQVPCLVVRNSSKASMCVFENERLHYAPLDARKLRKIRFLAQKSRQPFCRIIYMLGKIYSLLENKQKLTKREIYYQIKHLVGSQTQVNSVVEDITRLIGVGPWDLNIISHSGLVYGNLRLFWTSGEMTNCNTPATLIPYDLDEIVEIHSTAYFILVVEKESIFHKLLEEDLPNKLARPFIMITGKGVPDINTRLFLRKISTMLSLPVFILVDADVYGIRIMLNYRFGTLANCHLSDQLAVPNARWLGVFPSEINKYRIQHQDVRQREIKAINSLLKYPYMKEHPKISDELKLLLNSEKKASIEGLVKNNTFLSEAYLPMKFFNQDFI